MRPSIRAFAPLLVLVAIGLAAVHHRAETVPLYAARTGNACAQCHFEPNGGGPRNEFGFMYARNRHSLEPEGEGSPWKDLAVVNKIGESMPLYVGINQRFMLLANTSVESDSLDRLGFFNMENALHLAFQPHQALDLVYSRDAFSASSATGTVEQKDAFGKIALPWNAWIKAGRFRNPFGLRMDDHTVATRNGFLDFAGGERFLPLDPRNPDQGVEYGMTWGYLQGQVALTNGTSIQPFTGQFAEAKAVKIVGLHPWYQGGLSFYDEFRKEPLFGEPQRSTRWGYYGLTHAGPVAFVYEIAAGTDEAEALGPGAASGPKTNLLAAFAEVDWAPARTVNFRVRYDYFNSNRASDAIVREANTHHRWALEGEVVPVPFAELRWVVRRIDHADEALYGFEDETQFYAQAHFSY